MNKDIHSFAYSLKVTDCRLLPPKGFAYFGFEAKNMNSTVLHRSSLNIIQIYLTFSSDLFYSGLKCTLSRHIYKSALNPPQKNPTFFVFCVENKRRSHRLHLQATAHLHCKLCIQILHRSCVQFQETRVIGDQGDILVISH